MTKLVCPHDGSKHQRFMKFCQSPWWYAWLLVLAVWDLILGLVSDGAYTYVNYTFAVLFFALGANGLIGHFRDPS